MADRRPRQASQKTPKKSLPGDPISLLSGCSRFQHNLRGARHRPKQQARCDEPEGAQTPFPSSFLSFIHHPCRPHGGLVRYHDAPPAATLPIAGPLSPVLICLLPIIGALGRLLATPMRTSSCQNHLCQKPAKRVPYGTHTLRPAKALQRLKTGPWLAQGRVMESPFSQTFPYLFVSTL